MPGTVLDTGVTTVNKISDFIFSHRLYNKSGGEVEITQVILPRSILITD